MDIHDEHGKEHDKDCDPDAIVDRQATRGRRWWVQNDKSDIGARGHYQSQDPSRDVPAPLEAGDDHMSVDVLRDRHGYLRGADILSGLTGIGRSILSSKRVTALVCPRAISITFVLVTLIGLKGPPMS